MNGKRGAQLARMKAARFFNPLHVCWRTAPSQRRTSATSPSFTWRNTRRSVAPKIEAMMLEMPKFHSIVKTIKPLTQRKDAKGKREGHMLAPWLLARQSQ
tara:strand:- start:344 stop:643 length:300 start_codon:yes stop_codon:yes gene_type:complete